MPSAEVVRQRKEAGLCCNCGKRKTIAGKATCPVCLEKQQAYRKHSPNDPVWIGTSYQAREWLEEWGSVFGVKQGDSGIVERTWVDKDTRLNVCLVHIDSINKSVVMPAPALRKVNTKRA